MNGWTKAALGAVCCAGAAAASAAYVTLGGVRYESGSNYAVSASGTDSHGQFGAASVNETGATVSGTLVGPNGPTSLSAGFPIGARTATGHPLGTHFTVKGVALGTDLTYVWRISGMHTGVPDADAFMIDAAWSLYNGHNLWLGGFHGLSYIDSSPATGDFAGRNTGTFGCAPNANSSYDLCGSTWNGIGTRDVWLRDSGDEGWLDARIAIAGAGLQSIAKYAIELVAVHASADALAAAAGIAPAQAPTGQRSTAGEHGTWQAAAMVPFIEFDSGYRVAITAAPAALPLPSTAALAALGLALGLCCKRAAPGRRGRP